MKRRRIEQAVLLLIPVALFFWAARVRSWHPVEFPTMGAPIDQAAVSPDGLILATRDDEGRHDDGGRFYQLPSCTYLSQVWPLAVLEGQLDTIFMPDGKTIASPNTYDIGFWDIRTGAILRACCAIPKSSFRFVFNSTGDIVFHLCDNGTVIRQDVATGKLLNTVRPLPDANIMTLSHRGKLLALAGGWKEQVPVIWNVESGEQRELKMRIKVDKMCFAADDATLFTISSETSPVLRVWDASSGALRRAVSIPPVQVLDYHLKSSAAVSPDGTLFAGKLYPYQEVAIMNADTGQLMRTLPRSAEDRVLTFTPDSGTLITTRDYPAGAPSSGPPHPVLRFWRVK